MNLTDLREVMGLTVAQVAEELGVPKQDVLDSEETGSTYLLQPFIAAFPINPAIMTEPDIDPFLDSYVQNTVRERAEEWRASQGLSLERMAAALEMEPAQLTELERSGKITRALGVKIEKTVGMNRKWLMYGDGRNKGICILKPEKEGRRRRGEGETEESASTRYAPNREAGLRVKEARKEAGVSRDELAQMAGVSVSRIAQIESGYIKPEKAEALIRLMRPQMTGKDWGLQVREARKNAGLKLKEAAELAGVAPGTLAAMECGHISVSRAKEMIAMMQKTVKLPENEETFSKEAGLRIREERKNAGMTQKELGVILRVPESAVGRMELGNVTEKRAEEIIRRIHGAPRHSGGLGRRVKKTTQVLLGREIREARENAGLSQKQVGDLVGFPQSRISLIEKGQVDEATRSEILQAIADEMVRREEAKDEAETIEA